MARALMQAVDRELASARAAMQALATSPNLDRPDLRAFYGQASQVLHDRPGNILLLLDDHLHQVVNTHMPFGAPLPLHGNPVGLQRVIDSASPIVSDLYVGPTVGRLLTPVSVHLPSYRRRPASALSRGPCATRPPGIDLGLRCISRAPVAPWRSRLPA